MKALIKLIERDKGQVTVHVTAPPEWWDLVKHGHNVPLQVERLSLRRADNVQLVIHREAT